MKNFKTLMPVFALVFFGVMHLPKAKADDWDQKTILTFNEPVELPGVVLPAGTYVFKLADPWAVRDVVQVMNESETKLFATLVAIPTYRMKGTDKTGLVFEERPTGSREAIKAWFYHGSNYGEEFVYSPTGAMELAKASNPPPAPAEVAADIHEPAPPAEVQEAPAPEMQPSENEAQSAEIQAPELPAPIAPAESAPVTKLPKTASQLPWFLLIGIMSLTGSLALRVAAKKS